MRLGRVSGNHRSCGVESSLGVVAPDRPAAQRPAQQQPNQSCAEHRRQTHTSPPLLRCPPIFSPPSLFFSACWFPSYLPDSSRLFLPTFFSLFPSSHLSDSHTGRFRQLQGNKLFTRHPWRRQTILKPGVCLHPSPVISSSISFLPSRGLEGLSYLYFHIYTHLPGPCWISLKDYHITP
ncbi:hypothetical protein BJX64DRAFT_9297 [Aspergillus heterothallicus]